MCQEVNYSMNDLDIKMANDQYFVYGQYITNDDQQIAYDGQNIINDQNGTIPYPCYKDEGDITLSGVVCC